MHVKFLNEIAFNYVHELPCILFGVDECNNIQKQILDSNMGHVGLRSHCVLFGVVHRYHSEEGKCDSASVYYDAHKSIMDVSCC